MSGFLFDVPFITVLDKTEEEDCQQLQSDVKFTDNVIFNSAVELCAIQMVYKILI
jgi:hypothetical protein